MSTINPGEKPRRLNALDFLLIILILGAVAVAVVTVIRSNPNIISGGDVQIRYVITSENIPEAVSLNIKTGDQIYDDVSNQLLGTVTAVTVTQSSLKGYDENGNLVLTPIEGKTDISITVEASVWADENPYKIDNYRIAVGSEISYHSANISLSGKCVSIESIG